MNLVGSTLGDRVYHAAAGLAELSLKSRTRDLEFLDNILAELKRDSTAAGRLGIKRIIVIAAVHSVVVVVARKAMKADIAEFAVGGGPGGQQNKVCEVAPVQREGFDALLSHHRAERGLRWVHQWGRGRDGNDALNFAQSHLRANGGRRAHVDDHIFVQHILEP